MGPAECHGGGVTVFIKNDIHSKKSNLSSPDILVLDLDICWIIRAYILPYTSCYQHFADTSPENKLEETLTLCAAADNTKPIIQLLDANAWTKSEKAGGNLVHLPSDQKPVSARGQRMLSAWKRSQLVVLNGTHLEDASPGRFTSIKEIGVAEAVIDYAVVSEALLPHIHSLSIVLPVDPKEAWSDHISLILKVDQSILNTVPRLPRTARPVPILPEGDPQMEKLWEEVMVNRQTAAEMLHSLYGNVCIQTAYSQAYVQSSCQPLGTDTEKAVGCVFWGEPSSVNRVLTVPGPAPISSSRTAIYAVLLAVRGASPETSLMIFTNPGYTICHVCYWAGKNTQLG
jgi:hypothetical protein